MSVGTGDNGVIRQPTSIALVLVLWTANKADSESHWDRTRMIPQISSWIKIGIDFIKTLARQRKGRSGYPPSEPDDRTASECLVTGPESIVARPESQTSIKKEDLPSQQELERHDNSTTAKGLESATDGIAIRPESQTCTRQELERRREIVRQFFNDFWRTADDKPVTFAERLNRAESYINERLAARGEAWQLDAATRKQLALPPKLS